jgi:uncharacterized protein (DUF488 family)
VLVYGIGYEGRDSHQFVATLRASGVEVLIDVRLNASSRRRGFAKTALRAAVAAAGIEYLHVRELGNERDNREGFANVTGSRAAQARDRYRAHLTNGSSPAVDEVLKLIRERPAALLCVERDERHCHRQILLEHLQDLEPKLVAVPL